MDAQCNWFWGGHGCDLAKGDHKIHVCGSKVGDRCSEWNEETQEIRNMLYSNFETEGNGVEYGWNDWRPFPYGFTMD